jgi:hypothetical protein
MTLRTAPTRTLRWGPPTSAVTGPWSDRTIAWPETRTIGPDLHHGGYCYGLGVLRARARSTVWRPDHWALEGTDLRYGDELGRADAIVAYEVDGVELTTGPDGLPVPTGADGAPDGLETPATASGAPVEPALSSRAGTRTSREISRTPRAAPRPGWRDYSAPGHEQPRVHRGVHETRGRHGLTCDRWTGRAWGP